MVLHSLHAHKSHDFQAPVSPPSPMLMSHLLLFQHEVFHSFQAHKSCDSQAPSLPTPMLMSHPLLFQHEVFHSLHAHKSCDFQAPPLPTPMLMSHPLLFQHEVFHSLHAHNRVTSKPPSPLPHANVSPASFPACTPPQPSCPQILWLPSPPPPSPPPPPPPMLMSHPLLFQHELFHSLHAHFLVLWLGLLHTFPEHGHLCFSFLMFLETILEDLLANGGELLTICAKQLRQTKEPDWSFFPQEKRTCFFPHNISWKVLEHLRASGVVNKHKDANHKQH